MSNADIVFYWAAVTAYAAAFVAFVVGLVFKRERLFAAASWICALGLVPHVVAVALRWIAVGHGPYINRYEVFSSDAGIAVLLFVLVQRPFPMARYAGPVVSAGAFLLMGVGLMSSRTVVPLPPSLESYWLVLHVVFAKLSFGSYLVAAGLAVTFLLKERRVEPEGFWAKVPSPAVLDDLSYRFAALGFLFTGVMIAAGAVWANRAWGRYWGWDPVELWSLVVWLVFGLYLHLRITFRWKGRRAAVTAIGCLLVAALGFFVMPAVVSTLHGEYLVK